MINKSDNIQDIMVDDKNMRQGFLKHYKNAFISILVIIVFVISCYMTGFSIRILNKRGYRFFEFIGNMFPIDIAYGSKVLWPLLSTIQMSIAGTFLGAFLAIFTVFISASNIMPIRFVRIIVKMLVQCVRTIPVLIIALISTFIFGIGTFAGTFSLTLYTWAILTRIGSEDVEAMSLKTYNSIVESGAGKVKAFVRTVLVQMFPGYLNNTLYLLETNVRHASILGYVGAGGVGLLLNEKIAWREYSKVGTILIALFAAVVLIEGLSVFLSNVITGKIKIGKTKKNILLSVLLIIIVWSFASIGTIDSSSLGMKVAKSIFNGIMHPDLKYLLCLQSDGVISLLIETVEIAVAGTFIGALFAIILSFLSSSRFMPLPIAIIFRVFVMAIRTVPVLIYGIMFLRVTGPGSFAGVLTLSVTSIGLIAKRLTVSIDRMDMSSWNAYKAMGIGITSRIKYCLISPLIKEYISVVLYRLDVNIRGASVLGLVGAGGIGAPLIMYMNQYRWDAVGSILIGLFIMVIIVEILSSFIRQCD